MPFQLPALPYPKDALAPLMSAETLDYHHGKHHAGYVAKLNAMVEDTPEAERSLEEIVTTAEGGLLNNAAQHWNHSFFWRCLKPGGGGKPSGELLAAIERDFGTFEAMRSQLAEACATQFGSGWGWLVHKDGKLAIMSTANADSPLRHGATALLTIDVWEHAYYLDHRNARAKYIDAVLDSLVNWDFVAENLAAVS